jgi:hypothetical protein
VEQGQPSANGSLNDLQSVANAFKGWSERKENAAAAAPAAPEQPEDASQPEEVETAPVAEEGVELDAAEQPEVEAEADPETDAEAIELEVDGKTERFTKEELRANILRQRDYTRKTQELAEGRRLVEARAGDIGNLVRALGTRIQALDSQIKGEDTSAWDQLRQTDPAEWGARMVERQQRMGTLQAAQGEYQAQMARHQQEMQLREATLLREKIPAWKDNAVASREYGELIQFTVDTYGLTPDVLENVASDHRFVLLARDAKQGREATRKADVIKQQVRKLPRVQQPGAAGQRGATEDVAYRQSLDRLKTTGGRNNDDIAAAFRALAARKRR